MSPYFSLASYPPRRRLPGIVSRLLSACPRAGLLLPPLWAAPGIALQPLPGWASLWLLPALSTLSSLRQAKINWAESEVGAVSRFTTFHHFCLWEAKAWGFTSHLTSFTTVFHTKYSIKGQYCNHYQISSTTLWPAHWLRHRCFLLVSPKPSSPVLLIPLRHRGCLYDITGALLRSLFTFCGRFLVSLPFCLVCCLNGLCTLLS